MNHEMLLTFALFLVTIGLFVSDRMRSDLAAFLLLVTLMLTGLATPEEALGGFSNPALVMVAGLFVVGGAVYHTGLGANEAVPRRLRRTRLCPKRFDTRINPNFVCLELG